MARASDVRASPKSSISKNGRISISDSLFTGFGQRPQHLLGTLGLSSFLLGSLGLVYLAVTWLVRLWDPNAYPPLHERPLLIYALAALLLGAQVLSIGFLAELITAYQNRDEDSFSVVEQLPSPGDNGALLEFKNQKSTIKNVPDSPPAPHDATS